MATDANKVAETATDDDNLTEEALEPKGDKRLSEADEDDRDAGEDADETDEERERLREARRAERRQRSQRRQEAIQRDRSVISALERQNRLLAERLEALEGRTLQQDARVIDERLSQAQQEIAQAERALKDGVSKGDGDLVTRALRVRDAAAQRAAELRSAKERVSVAPQQRDPGPDPVVARFASDWAADNAWYDPSGSDPDSRIVAAIDSALASEGLDPRTDEYWDELDRRVERSLPHRFKKAGKRSSPPVSGGREHASSASRSDPPISALRKQALIDAGKWDDPVARKKAIAAFAEWDKNNAAR